MYNTNMLEKICIETVLTIYKRWLESVDHCLQKAQLDAIEALFDNEINTSAREDIDVSLINMLDNLSLSCRKYIDISSSAVGIGNDLDRERLRLCLEEMVC